MATAATWSDSKLLLRLRRRDRTAWDELYRTYEKRLYGFAYRLSGNQHDAADLVQETFVRALPKLDNLPPERANVGAYLFATAKNLFLKQKERAKRALPVDEVPEPNVPGDIEEDPQRAALLRRQQEEVRIATGKLAPRQRLVLALRELEDKSYAEIGELVGLNENAVAQLILRARQSLREELRLVQVDRSQLSETCQSYLPLLSAHLDGQLRGAKQTETLAHLEACEDCQKTLTDMEEAKRRYRALVPPLVAIVALREKVEGALAANGYWKAAPSRIAIHVGLGRRGLLVAAMAGVALLGCLAVGVGGVGGTAPTVAAESAQAGSAPAGSPVPGTSPTSGAPPESPTAPAETADEDTQDQPASGGAGDGAVGDASGGGDSPPAGGAESAEGDNGGTEAESDGSRRGGEPDASEGASGEANRPDGHGGGSGDSGDSRPETGSQQDDSSGGDGGTRDGGSQGDGGSQAAGDGSRGDSGTQSDDGSRGDTGSDTGSRGEEPPPDDTGSRTEEPPDETGSSGDTGSLTDDGSRGTTQPPPDDAGSRTEKPPEETGSRGDTGSLTDDGSRARTASS